MAEEKSQKNWFMRHKIVTGILTVVAFFIIIAAIGGDGSSSSKSASTGTAGGDAQAVAAPTAEKSYQKVFEFSGNGVKKSEPFVITGSKFRIKYDCKGSLCSAMLYEVGKDYMKDLIVNVTGNAKDETILYGKGEYYINANTLGTYTFIVEDYK